MSSGSLRYVSDTPTAASQCLGISQAMNDVGARRYKQAVGVRTTSYDSDKHVLYGLQENANGIGPWSLPSQLIETRHVEYGS